MSSPSTNPYTGKRALDLLVAGTACVAFAPIVAGIAVARRVTRFAVNLAGKRNVRRWLKDVTSDSQS